MADRFVARDSAWRLALLLLGAVAFVALGLWIGGLFGPSPKPGMEWLGWLAAFFFALAPFRLVPRLLDRSDQMIVDRNGIFWRQWSEATIPWSAIRFFSQRSIRGQHFVCLHLKDPAMFPRSGSGAWLAALNRRLDFGDVALTVIGTDRSHAELVAAIDRYAPEH
ncbi:MAG TPA: STM3941 family protein [Allosphingosinicella sp.]|nr:STM3941 family protein [Allosphingosinicella sp.]